MNETIIAIILIAYIAALIAASFAVKSQRVKRYYEGIDDRKLVEHNVQAKHLRKRILIIQYAVVAPLLVLGAVEQRFHGLLAPAILIFLCAMIIRRFVAGVGLIAEIELGYRKFNKDKRDA